MDHKTHRGQQADPPTLEYLRIASEASRALQSDPSGPARRRRDETIRWAARYHSVEEVAKAADVAVEYVAALLHDPGRDQADERKQLDPESRRLWARLLLQR